jgi:hypothetical protein
MSVAELPPITVVVGADGHKFCLDNRRLYILKDLRRKGLLPKNTITVLMRKAPPRDLVKYTIEKCSLNGTIMKEKEQDEDGDQEDGDGNNRHGNASELTNTATTESDIALTTPEDTVREKNDKKKKKSTGNVESDQDRYLRQKRIIAEKQEEFKRQSAERQEQKQLEMDMAMFLKGGREQGRRVIEEKDLRGGGDSGYVSDSDSEEGEEEEEEESEEESDEEVFVCDVCR